MPPFLPNLPNSGMLCITKERYRRKRIDIRQSESLHHDFFSTLLYSPSTTPATTLMPRQYSYCHFITLDPNLAIELWTEEFLDHGSTILVTRNIVTFSNTTCFVIDIIMVSCTFSVMLIDLILRSSSNLGIGLSSHTVDKFELTCFQPKSIGWSIDENIQREVSESRRNNCKKVHGSIEEVHSKAAIMINWNISVESETLKIWAVLKP
ncbi:hypothetical protein ABKN59_001977 [Abortiporus biennis]